MTFIAPAFRLALSCGLTAGLVAFANPANAAAPATDRLQRAVAIADLDLASPAGRATADRRIRAAADAVCEEGSPAATQRCFDRVVADAHQAMAERTPRPVALAAR
jgi:UrcA family protein